MEEMAKLEWMYKNAKESVDTEEYLLGRRIDKAFENQDSNLFNEVDKDILPASIFASKDSFGQVDVVRKLKEDPLEQIKQKEIDMRKQILKNPVKLKKLQNMLKAREEEANLKKEKKLKKKKKKKMKENLDELLAEKCATLMKKFGAKNLEELEEKSKKKKKNRGTSSSDSSDSSDEEKIKTKPKLKKREESSSDSDTSCEEDNVKHKNDPKFSKNKHSLSSDDEYEKRKSEYSNSGKYKYQNNSRNKGKFNSYHRMRSRSRSNERSKSNWKSKEGSRKNNDYDRNFKRRSRSPPVEKKSKTYDSSDDEKSKKPKNYGLTMPKGKQFPSKRQDSESNQSYRSKTESKTELLKQKTKPVKLSEKEKEAKLKEMMENAKWRDESRKRNVEKYREEERREKNKEKEYDAEFLRKQMTLATASASVEQRIKSNINNIQKSKYDMDKNFARR